jgi:glutaredoxin
MAPHWCQGYTPLEGGEPVSGEPIQLYTHRGCPGGRAAQQYFESHGLAYQTHDILLDEAARARFLKLGGIGTPLIVIGSRLLHGFDPAEFERLQRALPKG